MICVHLSWYTCFVATAFSTAFLYEHDQSLAALVKFSAASPAPIPRFPPTPPASLTAAAAAAAAAAFGQLTAKEQAPAASL